MLRRPAVVSAEKCSLRYLLEFGVLRRGVSRCRTKGYFQKPTGADHR